MSIFQKIPCSGQGALWNLISVKPASRKPAMAAFVSPFCLWTAALLTPRPPELLVLNEPETSLHPDLLPALASLIAGATEHAQVIAVTHAQALVKALNVSWGTKQRGGEPACRP